MLATVMYICLTFYAYSFKLLHLFISYFSYSYFPIHFILRDMTRRRQLMPYRAKSDDVVPKSKT